MGCGGAFPPLRCDEEVGASHPSSPTQLVSQHLPRRISLTALLCLSVCSGGSSALIASPCSTPVLASILGFVATSQEPYLGYVPHRSSQLGSPPSLVAIPPELGALRASSPISRSHCHTAPVSDPCLAPPLAVPCGSQSGAAVRLLPGILHAPPARRAGLGHRCVSLQDPQSKHLCSLLTSACTCIPVTVTSFIRSKGDGFSWVTPATAAVLISYGTYSGLNTLFPPPY